jgi:hypothetical protein
MAFDFSSVARSAAGSVASAARQAGGTVFDILNPAKQRLNIAGLLPGGKASAPKSDPNVGFTGTAGGSAASPAEDDWRVRISLAENSNIFYKDPNLLYNAIQAPLKETNGVVFPYTPSITIGHSANYNSQALTHSNYPAQFYTNSEVNDITISGEFTVQSPEEGQYLMAAVYFFRSATKMFFGSGDNVGNPPPIVFLDGYGSHYFPHVPCVVTNFSHTLSSDVDYIQVPITNTTLENVSFEQPNANIGSVQNVDPGIVPSLLNSSNTRRTTGSGAVLGVDAPDFASGARSTQKFKTIESSTRVPTASTISITLRTVYSRRNLHDRFDLNKFSRGELLADRDKGYGGFL